MAVSLGLGLAGLALAGYGEIKKNQAEKRAKQNLANRPKYSALPEDDSELNLATQQASQGMGSGARQQLDNNTDRNLATSANAILMGGGDANAIGSLADKTQNAYNNVAIYDDQARQMHLNTLLGTMSRYNAQRQGNADKEFQVNQYGPWADRQQLEAQHIAGGQQTFNSGLGLFAKGLSGLNYMGGQGTGISPQNYGRGASINSMEPIGAQQMPISNSGYQPQTYEPPGQSGGFGAGMANAASNFTTWGNGEPEQPAMTPFFGYQ